MRDYELISRKLIRYAGEADITIPTEFKLPDGYTMFGKPVDYGDGQFAFRKIVWFSKALESRIIEVYKLKVT